MLRELPIPSSVERGAVQLSATTPAKIGGVLQSRTSITVYSNDPAQAIWLLWVKDQTEPTAEIIKAQGIALTGQGSSAGFNFGLDGDGQGNTFPVLWGLADTSDQTSPNDTRWVEGR